VGLPGGGFGYALGIFANHGERQAGVGVPAFPQGRNPVRRFIPVARIADMLLEPGGTLDYDGARLEYPDIRLVYWAGGNPFHHHQDLGRLRRAFGQPETIVVHEPYWTATARHADIVLPSTVTLERNDIGASRNDPRVVAMHRVLPPFGEARDDFEIFRGLAARQGLEAAFTEGLDAEGWVRRLYEELRGSLVAAGRPAPDFETFWEAGEVELPELGLPGGWLRQFREDPVANPLGTPTGRIEIGSATIASFGYADCLGHPAWLAGEELLGSPRSARFPLQLIANQPAGRLHSQLDFGAASMANKRAGREVLRIHPAAAAERCIADGDTVRVRNDRGAAIAVAALSDALREDVVQLPTGAWFDPADPAGDPPVCLAGNPNAVTRDRGTSSLAQGCTGQLVLVEVELAGDVPATRGHHAPVLEARFHRR
jgi:biotin/methionine sulfoxide reductase